MRRVWIAKMLLQIVRRGYLERRQPGLEWAYAHPCKGHSISTINPQISQSAEVKFKCVEAALHFRTEMSCSLVTTALLGKTSS